ncbi:hypothetical protein [Jiella avicenniae]|uniref:DUF2946 domain-containing protein n=1 Tax=Jiella avicenniae TaxID=2907202 RepID=A0A9X1T4S9_9HYPH|nr:hypothetical protein [Jiella avicenniae]MCE7028871.1 hypothetical protein [Jiella avicenniae]
MTGSASPLYLAIRLIAVVVVFWGASFPMSAMAGMADAPSMSHFQTHDGHGPACAQGASCDGHAASTAHDHALQIDCGIHCVMALPDVAAPESSVGIVRSVAYSVTIDHLASLALPALERPPRV